MGRGDGEWGGMVNGEGWWIGRDGEWGREGERREGFP